VVVVVVKHLASKREGSIGSSCIARRRRSRSEIMVNVFQYQENKQQNALHIIIIIFASLYFVFGWYLGFMVS